MLESTINARAFLSDSASVPPLIYVSPELGEPALPQLMKLVERAGLIPLRIRRDSFRMPDAPGMTLFVGPGRAVTVSTLTGASLVGDITITDPPTWCAAVRDRRTALLAVGLHIAWERGAIGLRDALGAMVAVGAYAGAISVYDRSW